jgi:hypothetical protein
MTEPIEPAEHKGATMRPLITSITSKVILTGLFIFSLAASTAAAPARRAVVVRPGPVVVRGFHDPFWGPYYPYYYPFGYPYAEFAYGRPEADVRTEVTPKQTEVFVDGYYAGVADDFDGTFQRLHTSPGGHTITLYLDGYRTVTDNIYARPDSTYKLKETMEKLGPGETSGPVPVPTRPTVRSDNTTSNGDNGPQH